MTPNQSAPMGAAGAKRKVNPLTPIIVALPFVPAMFFVLILYSGGSIAAFGLSGIPFALVCALLFGGLMTAYQYLVWRRLTYWFDDSGDLRVDSGVLYRNERRLQLSRLQSVEIVQPLLARLFGMSVVKVDVAGGNASKAVLRFLTRTEAEDLRREIITRAAGVRDVEGVASGVADQVAAGPREVIATVATKDLFLSLLLRTSTFGLLAFTVLLGFVTFWTEGAAGVGLMPITGGVPLFIVISEFNILYGFTITKAADGVRLHSGLLQTRSQTVPPGRVQAIDFVEPLLWRRFGWVRIWLTVAGVAGSGNDDHAKVSESVLLPVAHRSVATEIFSHVMPEVDLSTIALEPAEKRARWRSPIQWSRLAVGHDDQVFVARRGWVTRHLSVVPHARTQSVHVEQGPYQRALGLASVCVDVAPGPVKVLGLQRPAAQARQIAQAQADRARTARAVDTSTHWATDGKPPTNGS